MKEHIAAFLLAPKAAARWTEQMSPVSRNIGLAVILSVQQKILACKVRNFNASRITSGPAER
jgi:hypothetical protein